MTNLDLKQIVKEFENKDSEELLKIAFTETNDYKEEVSNIAKQELKKREADVGKYAKKESNDLTITDKTEESKYHALNLISAIYLIIAWMVGISALIALIYGFLDKKDTGVLIIVYSLIYGLFGVISLLTISEGIKLFISIENNTSEQNKLLSKLIKKIK
ncbi:MAG: hypothetical protein ISR90_06140 [Candidatus Marinimicrobia bacterium]|nr:hypothetical protein [Candidatus Neomarinimicrobiota bacterium]MBL7023613.1 hypothetical protein [Candidatus Neomarinimicrobiota bacterium]MBL7109889.1 hypothetical protein [Candidatus Neomarinimicrobiota bacterium]